MSPALAAIVMRCLEKNPDRRWQDADDLTDELDNMMAQTLLLTLPAAVQPGTRRLTLARAVGTYLAAAIVVASGAGLLRDLFALPGWVPTGTMVAMAAALPFVLDRLLCGRKVRIRGP